MDCIVHGVTHSQIRLSNFHLSLTEKKQKTKNLVSLITVDPENAVTI